MSRSNRAALAAVMATLTLAACGGSDADAGAPGTGKPGDAGKPGTGKPGAPIPTATEIAALCDRACDHVEDAACGDVNPDCKLDCRESFASFPKACQAQLATVFTCYAEAAVTCVEASPELPSCAAKVIALQTCVTQNVELDPTYGGRCLPTSSTPEHSAERCGDLPETPKLYECTGGAPKTGCVADPNDGADLYCCPA